MTRSDPRRKILTQDELIDRQGRPRESRLVFTNGVFDLLHPGHVSYLAEARALGDLLVVAVNTDTSARRLSKGPDRPLVSAADRGYLLAALECVDLVTFFDEDTPRELIARLLPDVLVKGGDYTPDGVAGAQEVTEAGGVVRILPFLPGYSTTELVRRIRSGSID